MSHSKTTFWKPGAEAPGSHLSEERSSATDASSYIQPYNANGSLSIQQQRQQLPVFRHRNHILYLVEKFRTVVVVGETGCGKTTQIPQYLYEAGWASAGRVVGVTQPRRVAAVTVATRVAEERGVLLGREVGYAVRFDDCSDDAETRIKFLTDGLLIREMMSDPLLSKYGVLMLDEAHERSLHTDVIVGLLKKIQKRRSDLRLIVASATLDADQFKAFFESNETDDPTKDTAAVLTVEGRMFPVDVFYSLNPVPDYRKATVETVMKIHRSERPGDVLAFLTGQDEVQYVVSLLIEHARHLDQDSLKMWVLPMYGTLRHSDQAKVFQRTPRNCRKIVVATNVAETSITIAGIGYVVDAGFVKLQAFNCRCAVDVLVVVPVSQASAQQRAGRAGRATVPEMQRTSLAGVVLQLKALGVDNILRFPFLSPPPAQNMVQGVELLYALGAVDEHCRLTIPLGASMAEFPLNPMFAKMLLGSERFGCSVEALTVAAMMQIQNVFVEPPNQRSRMERAKRKFSAAEGDHVSMLNVYNAFLANGRSSRWCKAHFLHYRGLCRAVEIRSQLERMLRRSKVKLVSCEEDVEALQKCVTAAFFANAARFHPSGVYRTVRDDYSLYLHPTSVLSVEEPPAWLVFNDVVHTKKEFMRDITVIKPDWLYELAPHYYQYGTERELAAKKARLE
ncbi:hypothetical protein LSH36_330g06039 [Paralvinella palmiformis]|uniref:RNA helicase n=1 Tax=Paralvinella palmiformis TaxID=53620 RepID=A0AAD9JGT1_9ANNE|nr:hypothetical protein LSH36_330g06039 [Paralvinella palmiformis]